MPEGEFKPVPLDTSKVKSWDDLDLDLPEEKVRKIDVAKYKAENNQTQKLPDWAKKVEPYQENHEYKIPKLNDESHFYRQDLAQWRREMSKWSREYFARHPSIGGADSFREIYSVFLGRLDIATEALYVEDQGTGFTLHEQEQPLEAPEEYGRKTYWLNPYPSIHEPQRLDTERVIDLRTGRADGIWPYRKELAERIFGLRATDDSNDWVFRNDWIWGEKGEIPTDLGSFYLAAEMAEAWSRGAAEVIEKEGNQDAFMAASAMRKRPIAPIRDVPSPALEKVHEKHFLRLAKAKAGIKELSDDLQEVFLKFDDVEEGTQAVLSALVDRFYKDTKYVEGKNSLLDIFSAEKGEAEADCEGIAKAMAVILEEMGYSGKKVSTGYDIPYNGIKFELFSGDPGHVRLLLQVPKNTRNGLGSKGGETFVLEDTVQKWEPTPGAAVVTADELRAHLLFGEPLPIRIEPGLVPTQEPLPSDVHEAQGYGYGGSGGMAQHDSKFDITGTPVQNPKPSNAKDSKKTSEIASLRIPRVLKSYGDDAAAEVERRIVTRSREQVVAPVMLPEESKVGPLLMSIKERLKHTSQEFWQDLSGSLSDLKRSAEGLRLRKEYAIAAVFAVQGVSSDEATCVGIDVADAAMTATSDAYHEATAWSVEEVKKRAADPNFVAEETNLYDKKLTEYWKTHFDSIDYIVSRELANVEAEARPTSLQITPGLEERFVTEGFWNLVEKQGTLTVEFLSPDPAHPLTLEEIARDLPESMKSDEAFIVLVDGEIK